MRTTKHAKRDDAICLDGVFTALITPFTSPDAGQVDLERLRENVRLQRQGGVTGVVPCGTTGEAPTLSDDEHRRVVQTVIEAARPRGLKVIAGAGSNCTRHAIELHEFTCDIGADAALHVAPYYNKPSQEGLYRHFMTIADSGDMPIVLYNIPGRTAVAIDIDTIARLAEHPNIVAVKDATGSIASVNAVIERTDLVVLSGDDPMTLAMCAVGGRGAISVLSNIYPQPVAQMVEAVLEDRLSDARSIHKQFAPLARLLLALGPNPEPIKAAMARCGLDTGLLRLPLAGLNAAAKQSLDEVIERIEMQGAEQVDSAVCSSGGAITTVPSALGIIEAKPHE